MTAPNRETPDEANTALIQRWSDEGWSNGTRDIALTATDRLHRTVLQLGDGGDEEALREYLTSEIAQPGIVRRMHPP